MDEPLALLIMLPALLFGIWAVDLAGANALGTTTSERAATEAAQVAASVIADQTPLENSNDLVVGGDAREAPAQRARLAAEAVVRAASIGVCAASEPANEPVNEPANAVTVDVSYDEAAREVTVVVVCQLRVSGGLSRSVVASATAQVHLGTS